ncbi:hypothetical protein [Streptacidiphilus sp. EB103A]|uniref:hypothetical protein n=1 Tax=Streptacidiphilus sp. EB103A TaxID=3156275 RepID=UPI003515EC1D
MTNSTTTPVFHKTMPAAQARAEIGGWQQVAGRLQVPALIGHAQRSPREHVVTYEDVFVSGRCQYLLGDLIAIADQDPSTTHRVTAMINAVCDDLITAAATTGRTTTLDQCTPALYQDRIRPGGRVDTWYLQHDPAIAAPHPDALLPLSTLTGYRLTANGTPLHLDVPKAIRTARRALHPGSTWTSAITQGDPTEPNIATSAAGACWLDLEHAGRNTLPGEIANLLWYLLAMGGWLVPVYQPDVYARTLPLHYPPPATPRIEHVDLSPRHRRLDIHYTWPLGPGRHAALTQLLARLAHDLGPAAGLDPARPLTTLAPFLTLRILGVIPPSRLTATDLLLLLAKLAEAQAPQHPAFTRTDPLPALTAPLERP